MAERVVSIEERIKKKQSESPITRAAVVGNWISVFTMAGAIIFAAPVALGIDILGTVAGAEIKDRNDRRIANQEKGRLRIAKGSRMAQVEKQTNTRTEPTPIRRASSPDTLAA